MNQHNNQNKFKQTNKYNIQHDKYQRSETTKETQTGTNAEPTNKRTNKQTQQKKHKTRTTEKRNGRNHDK